MFKKKFVKRKKEKNKASKKASKEAATVTGNNNRSSLNEVNTVTKRKTVTKCTTENLQTKKKTSTIDKIAKDNGTGLPKQSSFCTACKTAGHNRVSCGKNKRTGEKTVTKKKTRVVQCKRCELTGHTEVQCCYIEVNGATVNGLED